MLEDIVELHQSGQLDQAETRYRELLSANPDDPEVLHLLGIVRRQRGDFHEAMQLVERAIELLSNRANYHMSLGGMRLHARLLEPAQESFENAIKLDPNLSGAYSALGQIAMLRGDVDRAESHFKVALHATQDDPQVLTSLGNLQMSRGNSDLALKYLSRAAELRPQDPAIQASLGRTFLSKGMTAFAEQALSNALQTKPDFFIARLALAEAQVQQSKMAAAAQNFSALIAAEEHVGAAYIGLGDIARAAGDLDRACGHYERALVEKPQQPKAAIALSWCLHRLGQIDNAIKVLTDAFYQMPHNINICGALTELLSHLGQHAEAAAIWKHRLAEHPQDSTAIAQQALALEQAGDLKAAITAVETLPIQQNRNAELLLLQVRAALRDKQGATALDHLKEVDIATLSPFQARLHCHYQGLALDILQRPDEAVAAWLQAHRMGDIPGGLPPLSEAPAAMVSMQAKIEHQSEDSLAPIFLIGAPGSGVDRIAALLADQASVTVLRDRFGPDRRHDDFTEANFDPFTQPIDADLIHRFARRYRRGLTRLGVPTNQCFIDWLPHWNAHSLPLVAAAFPKTKFIVVSQDVRDELLNWLAYGWAPDFTISDVQTAAVWLSQLNRHIATCAQAITMPVLQLNAQTVFDHFDQYTPELAQFLNLPGLIRGAGLARAEQGLGGLSVAFPAGHWQAYREVLSAAFSQLKGNAAPS